MKCSSQVLKLYSQIPLTNLHRKLNILHYLLFVVAGVIILKQNLHFPGENDQALILFWIMCFLSLQLWKSILINTASVIKAKYNK